jgi:hypothetical protein
MSIPKTIAVHSQLLAAGVAAVLAAWPAAAAEAMKPTAYYFPRKESCTVMMDFQKSREKLRGLNGETRALELARSMLVEWLANAAGKCDGSSKVTMLAVYIPGVDVYGRPDFGNRTNLMKLEGDATKLQALGRNADKVTMVQLQQASRVEVF